MKEDIKNDDYIRIGNTCVYLDDISRNSLRLSRILCLKKINFYFVGTILVCYFINLFSKYILSWLCI